MYVHVPNGLAFYIGHDFSSGHGSILALLAAGRAGGPRVHHRASVGPGWAPWRVLCAFEVARFVGP